MSSERTLEAGRELDALVAERVFGWIVERQSGNSPWLVGHGANRWTRIEEHRFSTEITAAWPIAESLGLSVVRSEEGWYAIQPTDIEHGYVRGTGFPTLTLVGEEHERWEAAPSAPLAICRAALAALASRTEPEAANDHI